MKVRRWAAGLLAILIGCGAAFALMEVVVRVFFDEPMQPRFVIDTGYGVRGNQPNVETMHYVPGDYKVTITTNSAGMRGRREYPVEKPPGTRRVLILGDSFPFGFGVNDDQVVSSVLEDLLNSGNDHNRRFEVINLSVSGFGQAEELVTYRHAGRPFKADVVVLFYFQNDIGNNSVSGLFKIDGQGKLVRTGDSYLPAVKTRERLYSIPLLRWLFEHSAAWNLIRNRLSSIVQKQLLRKKGLKTFSDVSPDAVRLTRELLLEFIREIQSDGAIPIIVSIPHKGSDTSNFPLTEAEVTEAGALFVDASQFVSAGDYYDRDSHWRPSGHRKAANHLARLIEAQH